MQLVQPKATDLNCLQRDHGGKGTRVKQPFWHGTEECRPWHARIKEFAIGPPPAPTVLICLAPPRLFFVPSKNIPTVIRIVPRTTKTSRSWGLFKHLRSHTSELLSPHNYRIYLWVCGSLLVGIDLNNKKEAWKITDSFCSFLFLRWSISSVYLFIVMEPNFQRNTETYFILLYNQVVEIGTTLIMHCSPSATWFGTQ